MVENPRTEQYRLRLNSEEKDQLNYICSVRNMKASDLLRKYIRDDVENLKNAKISVNI